MEIRHFQLVVKLAQHKSLKKASEELFLTPSALSYQLKELESEIGTPLFYRSNKKMQLSKTGEIFLKYSENFLENIDSLKRELIYDTPENFGDINFSIQGYTSYFWFPQILKEFQLKYPNVDIHINTHSLTKPLTLLMEKRIDYAITILKTEDKNFSYYPLFEDEIVVVLSKKHHLANHNHLDFDLLKNENIISHSTKSEIKTTFESVFGVQNFKYQKHIHVPLTLAILEMLKENLGVSILSKWAVSQYLNNNFIKAIKLEPHGSFNTWYLVKLRNKIETEYEKHFIKIIKQYFNNL